MPKSAIVKAWTFGSKSHPNDPKHNHQCLQYEDGSTSCDCFGWTRRCADDGTRTCPHVRAVEMGTADDEAVSMKDYRSGAPARATQAKPVKAKPKARKQDGDTEPTAVVRKIQW